MSSTGSAAKSVKVHLDELAKGFPNITKVVGGTMAEAAAFSLDHRSHACGVLLRVEGTFSKGFEVHWKTRLTEATRRTWNDLDIATEYGAYGLAILLMRALTGYTVIERSKKGTGFDWWLGTEDDLFQTKARLEVSGISQGTRQDVSKRLEQKKEQTKQSDEVRLPAYIAVVEFGTPMSKVVQR